nr:hypothetical protein [Tanacetum cinerariifolium]
MDIDQDRQMLMIDDNVGNQFRQNAVQYVGHLVGQNAVQNQARAEGNGNGINGNTIRCYNSQGEDYYASNCTEFDFMVAAGACEETERDNANCALENNLQQASTSGTQSDKAPVYDTDGSTEYSELLEPIPEPHQVPQNDSNVIFEVSSVEQGGGTVEQHPANVEETPYNDMQQKIKRLQAQLGDLKGKGKDTSFVSDILNLLPQKLENENVELEFQVRNYEKENAHLKTAYKNLFDSINVSEQKDTTRRTSANTKFAKLSILGKPPSSSRPKLVDNVFPNKPVKASVRTKPIIVSQPHAITKNDVKSKTNSFSPTDVKITTRTRRPLPRNNPKNDKQWLITINHDVCVLNYVNGMNSRGKKQKANVSNIANQKKHKDQESVRFSAFYLKKKRNLLVFTSVDMIVVTSMIELESLFGHLFNELFKWRKSGFSLKSSAVTTADASDKRQKQQDSTSSTSTLATTITADGNFDLGYNNMIPSACTLVLPRLSQNQRDLPRNTPLDRVEVLASSESRPPMRNKENYVPWSSRLLRYAKSRPNGKLIHNSILNGPYIRRMILEPGDVNREVTMTETFHVQTDDELSDKELKQIEADNQAIQTILLGLPEDIYAAVESCETAQEIWFTFNEGESIESYYHRFLKLKNDLKRNKHFPEKIASNLKFLNILQPEWKLLATTNANITDPTTAMNMGLALMAKAFKLNYSSPTNNNQRISSNPCNRQIAQPGQNAGNLTGYNDDQNIKNQNQIGNGNLVAARAEGNAAGQNGNQIRCYNCKGVGHYARNCTVRPRRRDAAYLQTQLLIAQKEEAGIQL